MGLDGSVGTYEDRYRKDVAQAEARKSLIETREPSRGSARMVEAWVTPFNTVEVVAWTYREGEEWPEVKGVAISAEAFDRLARMLGHVQS